MGTRRCTSLDVIDADSVWLNGHEWMTDDIYPSLTSEDTKPTRSTRSQQRDSEKL